MAKSVGSFNFDDVFDQLKTEIHAIMISPETKSILQKHMSNAAQMKVYPFYAPHGIHKYQRRYDEGGLMDPKNYEVTTDGEMSLKVVNNTTGNGNQPGESWTSGPINDIIENGTGYGWKNSDIYEDQPYPRPFMQDGIDAFMDDYLLDEIHERVFK